MKIQSSLAILAGRSPKVCDIFCIGRYFPLVCSPCKTPVIQNFIILKIYFKTKPAAKLLSLSSTLPCKISWFLFRLQREFGSGIFSIFQVQPAYPNTTEQPWNSGRNLTVHVILMTLQKTQTNLSSTTCMRRWSVVGTWLLLRSSNQTFVIEYFVKENLRSVSEFVIVSLKKGDCFEWIFHQPTPNLQDCRN